MNLLNLDKIMRKSLNSKINFKGLLGKAKVKISLPLPFISYEVSLNDALDSQNIDTRIARLTDIKEELESAILAVESLQNEAHENKQQVNYLQERIRELEEDKNTAEAILKVPQDSFVRLIEQASSKGRMRGWFEGLIIGLLSGVVSSLAAWFITENILSSYHSIPLEQNPSTPYIKKQ